MNEHDRSLRRREWGLRLGIRMQSVILPVLRGSEMDTDIVSGPEKSPTRVILKPGLWKQRRVLPGHSRQTQNESFLAT